MIGDFYEGFKALREYSEDGDAVDAEVSKL